MKNRIVRNCVLLVIVTSFASYTANSQWRDLFVPDGGTSLLAVHAFDSVHAICVGDAGTIVKTENWFETVSYSRIASRPLLMSVAFFDSSNGLVCGAGGSLYRTTDRGETWHEINSGVKHKLCSVICLDSNTCIAVGDIGTVLQSDDSGRTFYKRDLGLSADLTRVYACPDSTVIILTKQGFTLKSDRNRTNWTKIDPGFIAPLFCIQCNTDGICLMGGDSAYIFKSTDFGSTWIEKRQLYKPYSKTVSHGVKVMHMTTENVVYITGEFSGSDSVTVYTRIWVSYNLGENWERIICSPAEAVSNGVDRLTFNDLIMSDSKRGVAVGPGYGDRPGSMLCTTLNDWEIIRGRTLNTEWIVDSTGNDPRYFLRFIGVDFSSVKNGCVYRSDGTKYVTANGGETWSKSNLKMLQLRTFSKKSQCAVLGSDSAVVYISHDGGVTWGLTSDLKRFGTATMVAVSGIAIASDTTIFLLTQNAYYSTEMDRQYILRSDDGGSTWSRIRPKGLAADSVLQWYGSITFQPGVGLWAVAFVNDSALIFTPYLLLSTNLGDSWVDKTPAEVTASDKLYLGGGPFWYDSNHVWLGVHYNPANDADNRSFVCLRSTNGGQTWTRHDPRLDTNLHKWLNSNINHGKVFFVDSLHGWMMVGSAFYHQVVESTDGGVTWREDQPGDPNVMRTSYYLYDYQILNEKNFYICGQDMTLLHWSGESNLTSATEPEYFQPDSLKQIDFLVQVPRDSKYRLQLYDADPSGMSTLSFFDVQGNQVQSMQRTSGDLIDCSNFMSGLYMITLRAKDVIRFQKVLIIH